MAKLTKLQRSNGAHKRLHNHHKARASALSGKARDTAVIKADYHDEAMSLQTNIGHVLTKTDKKEVYQRAVKRHKRKQALGRELK